MKRLLSAVLAVLTLLSMVVFASCGNETGPANQTTAKAGVSSEAPANNEDSDTTPQFKEGNYNGGDFTVYICTSSNYSSPYISAVETNGDLMNDSTWNRNLKVEEKFNVSLKFLESTNPSKSLTADVASGDCPYSLLFSSRTDLADHIAPGELTDFNKLECDITTDWWDTRCISDLSIRGKAYLMLSDISTARFAGLRFLYFNKNIISGRNLPNPYDNLANDTWYLDNFLNLVKSVQSDSTSSEFGTYGLVLETGSSNGVYMHMIVGCGLRYSKFDANGDLICTIDENIDLIDTAFDKMKTTFSDKTCVLTMDESDARDAAIHGTKRGTGDHKYARARSMFAQGHYLFTHTSIAQSALFTETMVDDFGLMPNPKYNENQKEYSHKSDPYTVCFAIPNCPNIDLEQCGTILDYWSYISNEYTIQPYYDVTIKSKKVKDPTASDVVDIVRRTAHYELIDVFEISGVTDAISGAYNNGNIAKQIAAYKRSINSSLKKINETFASLD